MLGNRNLIMFFADAMLGRLAKWLRVLGFDTLYEYDIEDADLVGRARAESRVILTRDTALARSLKPGEYLFVNDDDPVAQLKQLIEEMDLQLSRDRLFSRCLKCNSPVERVEAEDVRDEVPEYVLASGGGYRRCTGCNAVYWAGTHLDRILERLAPILGAGGIG